MTKRASYRNGVQWIGGNDEPSDLNVKTVSELISVCLLADLFSKSVLDVAIDVVNARVKSRRQTSKPSPSHIVQGGNNPYFTEDDIPF